MSQSPPYPADFATDVIEGLDATPRRLPSKWFYDATGDRHFQAIMASPEYYLTDCEREIFQTCGGELLATLGDGPFELIELGAGDGSKTQYLIESFLASGADFSYRPIDISANAIATVGELINRRWPGLDFRPLHADYFRALDALEDGPRRLLLFPGANIGNYTPEEALDVLRRIRTYLRPGDYFLIGFDLKKDPATVLAAYNDAAGHTAAFNLNLLARINRELGGDFPLDAWHHWETYNPSDGAARSYLVPNRDHTVTLSALNRSYDFRAWQAIQVEVSQKYDLAEVEALAKATGFRFAKHFQDERGWFADSLFNV